MGVAAEVVAACFRGAGTQAECLPMPDREAVRLGRRHTSGKECLPMTVTLGSLLQRLEREPENQPRFVFLMPRALGPCRFGMYSLLHQIIVQRLGLANRVRVWSPADADYFAGLPRGFRILLFAGVVGADLLNQALLEVRPVETRPGVANDVFARHFQALLRLMERGAGGDLSAPGALWQVAGGELFGVRELLRNAAEEFAAVRTAKAIPTVLVVGEIYVRLDPFANDFIVDKLEQRGLRAQLAPTNEWLEYVEECNLEEAEGLGLSQRLVTAVQGRILHLAHSTFAEALGWPHRATVPHTLAAAKDYVRPALHGEAVLTVGGPVHEWREQNIDAVVSVGPLECMPNKIAEAQFFHVAEHEGLLNLTLSLNGDPVAREVLDNFAFEVHARFRERRVGVTSRHSTIAPRTKRSGARTGSGAGRRLNRPAVVPNQLSNVEM
jgi:predicted nucleotide-binding protein (sugar kinase/HSP70/actin superfamily)